MNLYSYHSDPDKLIGNKSQLFLIPELAFHQLQQNPDDPDKIILLKTIARDPDKSLRYATEILNYERFKLGEPAIARTADTAWFYVDKVLKDRFKLAEPVIFANPWYREQYFKNLKKYDKWDDSILDDFEKWNQHK